MAMVVTDPRQPDNPIVLANQAFLDLTGYDAGEVVGRNCRLLQGERTCPEAVSQLRAAVREGREIEVQLLNYRKDGTTFWNEVSVSAVRADDGELLYFFASQRDVTHLRRVETLEQTEQRLLKELDHRTLNALSVVTGIMRLTRAEDTNAYAAAVQSRIQAVVRAHSLLAQQGWREAPLEGLIRMEVEPYGKGRVLLEGPAVQVAAEHVQPLVLVMHEMISNAAHHGALSGPEGSVTLNWQAVGDRVSLDWVELGGPPPADDRPAGFGSTIIKATLERQLGGALDQTWDAAGLKATLQFRPSPKLAGEPLELNAS